MLELYGTGYVIDHCISRLYKEREIKYYQMYVTDALMCISRSLHKVYGGGALQDRYIDLIEPKPEETRSADEIKLSILNKLKGGEE